MLSNSAVARRTQRVGLVRLRKLKTTKSRRKLLEGVGQRRTAVRGGDSLLTESLRVRVVGVFQHDVRRSRVGRRRFRLLLSAFQFFVVAELVRHILHPSQIRLFLVFCFVVSRTLVHFLMDTLLML